MAEPSSETEARAGPRGGPTDRTAATGTMWGGATSPPPAPPPVTPPPGPAAAAAAPPASGSPERHPTYHGTGGALFGIYVVTGLLTLVTLGIYSFWAKVRGRRYHASQTEFEGDRFTYHGTGRELLYGTLKAGLLFAVPVLLLKVVPSLEVELWLMASAVVLAYAIIALLLPFAIVGARRYRLSRTSWRGIRFSFRGRAVDFLKLFLKGGLLTLVTFGLYYPVFVAQRQKFLVSHSYFGNRRFDFDGKPRDLFNIYALATLLWIPTFGFYWFWYRARRQRYMWDHTSFGDARFRCTVTADRLLGLYVLNILLLVVTLGLALPWVIVRTTRFNFEYLALAGPLDLASIAQEAQTASATGEGLAGFLDAGLDLDG
jgi:uncharacterized membrane protein YjgN (DUF898 family)